MLANRTSVMRYKHTVLVLCIAILWPAVTVMAQRGEMSPNELRRLVMPQQERQTGEVLGVEDETARLATPPLAGSALDIPINPETYILGPGDVLGVSLRGAVGAFYRAEVTPGGNLIVPQLPMLHVEGLTLNAAIDTIATHWSGQLQDAPVDAALLQMRKMRVSVGGEVKRPGQYIVTPADRALTLVELAGGFTEEASDRHAMLIHSTDSSRRVDKLMYYRSGILSANPLLTSGAHLIVEPKTDDILTVEVGGGVRIPGTYEWLPDDHAVDLIRVAGGLRDLAVADSILLTRFVDGEPATNHVKYTDILATGGPRIQPGDLLYVQIDWTRNPARATVLVQGEVKRPGRYPIVAGRTRLMDVLERAGGLTELAYPRGARIWVQPGEDFRAQEYARIDTLVVTRLSRFEDQFQRDLARTQGRNFVPVDFTELLDGESKRQAANNIVMYDSMVVNIPRKVHHVIVMGMVEEPGFYTHQPGWEYEDYIDAAGGYLKEADKRQTRITPFQSGQVILARNDIPIYPGDIVFVPDRFVRPFWDVFREYFSVFLQAATLGILILQQ